MCKSAKKQKKKKCEKQIVEKTVGNASHRYIEAACFSMNISIDESGADEKNSEMLMRLLRCRSIVSLTSCRTEREKAFYPDDPQCHVCV